MNEAKSVRQTPGPFRAIRCDRAETVRMDVVTDGEEFKGSFVAGDIMPEDAARIARLLNAEEAVRAALDAAASYIHHVEESEARHVGREGSIPSPTLAKVRAALSALGEG